MTDTTTSDPRTEWVTVTPEYAAEMLDSSPGNRAIRGQVVQSYARDMEAGRWLKTGESIKVAANGELLDGHHRLTALIGAGLPQRMLIVRDLDPLTRAVIDTGLNRTGGDALRMAGLGGSSPYALAAAARLLFLWEHDRLNYFSSGTSRGDRLSHQELIDVVTANPELETHLNDSTRDYERIGMPTGPQTMTRKILFGLDAEDAERFFDALAGYATEGTNDPRAVLLYTLRQMRAMGQLRRPGESIGLTFAAWNAWRDRQKITALPTRDKKGSPLRIPMPV